MSTITAADRNNVLSALLFHLVYVDRQILLINTKESADPSL